MSDRSQGVQAGRFRADFPEGTVVFLIGMRVNSLWRVRTWLRAFTAMPRMLQELHRRPELGLLHARNEFAWRRATVVQYWESMDKLMAYAASRDHEHLPAWVAFNQRARTAKGVVGVWHEAYTVNPAISHVIYSAMPVFGMGKATSFAPVNHLPHRAEPSASGLKSVSRS